LVVLDTQAGQWWHVVETWRKAICPNGSMAAAAAREHPKSKTAALYWIREPRGMLNESRRSDELAVFAGYWNAFECVVDAVNILRPAQTLSPLEKKTRIADRLKSCGEKVGPGVIAELYRDVVDPPLRYRAQHAMELCLGTAAGRFMAVSFDDTNTLQCLYGTRNSINHGKIDVNDPNTMMIIESHFMLLHALVFAMIKGFMSVSLDRPVAGDDFGELFEIISQPPAG
jgi:hypothetical protein